jgi:polysaccharide deacetylase family protein (PEP-CTERM system associated)
MPAATPARAVPAGAIEPIVNAMTVDVEDYFQVEAVAGVVSRAAWDRMPSRVERNCDRLLARLADAGVRGTFFTLAWIAERHPGLVRRIVAGGHELASHGLAHIRADRQTPDQFRADVRDSKARLEDLGGVAVAGYRAATFSIGRDNFWAYDILAEAGYRYSSSLYPVRHDLYGMPEAPRAPFRPGAGAVVELPLSTVRLLGRNLPFSGGGYFRLLPYGVSRWGMRRINRRDGRPCIFYLHPWEIDADQPRQAGLPLKSRLRHYLNLRRTEPRLKALLGDFRWGRMDEIFLGAEAPPWP